MWEGRFLFVWAALFAIGIWIASALRRDAIAKGRSGRGAWWLGLAIILVAFLILIAHATRNYEPNGAWWSAAFWPGPGAVLALVLGGAVGGFTAKFVWSLFHQDSGRMDPLIGAAVLAALIVVYTLPVYERELAALLGHLGLTSLKLPFVEVTLAERSPFRRTPVSASSTSNSGDQSTAIPRPSNPRPGLQALWNELQEDDGGYFAKEDRYIQFFNGTLPGPTPGTIQDRTLRATAHFLSPARIVAGCLLAYVEIIPDSQLILLDIRPLLTFLFRTQAEGWTTLSKVRESAAAHPGQDFKDFKKALAKLRDQVFDTVKSKNFDEFKTTFFSLETKNSNETRNSEVTGEYLNACSDAHKVLAAADEADKVLPEADEANKVLPEGGLGGTQSNDSDLADFTYLQPYTTIALANLLDAIGSSDEAIEVLSKWLDLWHCARGKKPDRDCEFEPIADASKLPEWFGIRAEFEINIRLYQIAGEGNVTYHDFLVAQAKHFADFASPRLSISTELDACRQHPPTAAEAAESNSSDDSKKIRATMLRSLLQNEDTLLRSELRFLPGKSWSDLENLVNRAQTLASFRLDCVDPLKSNPEYWGPTLDDYKITAGILSLAAADALAKDPTPDERAHAEEIKKKGISKLREGYRALKCNDRDAATMPWSKRIFNVSPWAESCALAERALDQLAQ